MIYPTPKEILRSPPKFPKIVTDFMKNDFNRLWQKWPNHRQLLLILLVNFISQLYSKSPPTIKHGKLYKYNTNTKVLILGPTISIINTLHEIGHHLFGKSELKACRFSVHLFKQTFPRAFQKLKWKGHMLILNK